MAVDTISPPSQPLRSRRGWLASRRRQVVAGLVILAALGFLAFQGLSNATQYFKTADQAVADKARLGTSQFRLEGTVEPGIRHDPSGTEFDVIANNVSVHVIDSQQPPQLFKVGIPVVLEGHWQGSYYSAFQIMVKHTANYVESHPDRLKSQLPTTATSAP
ncbi:cytochrome c maturation protein CcmE [Acidiferrimicrobium sp. IK]|uniref:cytochrome c maturation protein CcmE n=1 Tax=Acidiferrimicrobium sp. IK TaxID=2871700 RepID=UPI0021CAF923|nr:cytochrome c maturation protein CcmE [Acidiferrimicrobium sp. IK]MCU4185850.1 cytochrome c maturation protein CcmE [Acidiferrimicrobium sp. IK]